MTAPDTDDVTLSWRRKLRALHRVALFQPAFAASVVVLAVVTAVLEGVGITFIEPIIEVSRSNATPGESSRLLDALLGAYDTAGVPVSLGTLVAGVAAVMTVRYTTSFLVGWFRAAIETRYVRHLQEEAFDHALDAGVAYFDQNGSDEVLNAIVTQSEYAGQVIQYAIKALERALLALIYFAVAFYLAPVLTLVTAGFLGATTYLFRNVLDAGYTLGDEVAAAKESIQSNAQAGTQGIRDVKLFGLADELRAEFTSSLDAFERSRIRLLRNDSAISSFYQLTTAITVFALVYVALAVSAMSVAQLGVFLFAMFQLGPTISSLNSYVYRVEGELPHLVRTQAFVAELRRRGEVADGTTAVPTPIDRVEFRDVGFRYESADEPVLDGVSFGFDRGEFVAFVGPSGAGKSTIASLLARLYDPDDGDVLADGTPIRAYDVASWRDRVSVVRQDPYVFDDTLRRNLTVGNRDASRAEIERAAEIAQVDAFAEELPDGYDTVLGDQGVRLSGGQRQRVAIARALLEDGDVLVLDEATSDLDASCERRVHRGIEAMDRDCALVVIAHELSTVTDADEIHVVEDGELRESGSHRELLDVDGTYSRLYELQASGT